MRTQGSVRLKALLLLSIIEVILVVVSTFLLLRLYEFINSALYEFGLQFSYEWAEECWTYVRLSLGLLWLTAALNIVSAVYIQVRGFLGKLLKPRAISAILLIGGVVAAASAFLFTQLDSVVHGDLYRYGLQFSYQWAEEYWTNTRLILSLTGIVSVLDIGSAAYVLAIPHSVNVTYDRFTIWFLSVAGGIALLTASIYGSAIGAFIGLGLIFWGAVLFYIRPQSLVRESGLSTAITPALIDLDHIVKNLGYNGKAIYLSPEYLRDFESSRVYIGEKEDSRLPTPEEIEMQQESPFLNEPKGLLISPSGVTLCNLMEKTLGTSFTKIDLRQVGRNMRRAFVEELGLAKNLYMEIQNNKMQVRIEGLANADLYGDNSLGSKTPMVIDRPITSAIACSLAKASGKPVLVERERRSEDGETLEVEYSFIGGLLP